MLQTSSNSVSKWNAPESRGSDKRLQQYGCDNCKSRMARQMGGRLRQAGGQHQQPDSFRLATGRSVWPWTRNTKEVYPNEQRMFPMYFIRFSDLPAHHPAEVRGILPDSTEGQTTRQAQLQAKPAAVQPNVSPKATPKVRWKPCARSLS